MKLAIMQPYFFPYLGYFQLAKAVDRFVFYDDVTFIKGGWIYRNRILINKIPAYWGVPMKGASSNKLINEIELDPNPLWKKKLLKTIEINYKKAPHFQEVFPLINHVINMKTEKLSAIARESVIQVAQYLDLKTKFITSSTRYNNQHLKAVERVIDICKQNNANIYINAKGGQSLYDKETFQQEDIQLQFISSQAIVYPQFSKDFMPALSIIDVLMFNTPQQVQTYLDQYDLF